MKDHAIRILAVATLTLLLGACSIHTTDRYVRDGDRNRDASSSAQNHELICHKGKKTMSLPSSAISAHLGHGDRRGRC